MQVVVRTLRILSLIGEGRPEGISLTELSSELDLPMPTVHRLLKVLVAEEMAYRDPHSLQYFPGKNLLKIAQPRGATNIAELVGPQLRELSAKLHETVFVAQLVGHRAVCVALAESRRPLRISVELGYELPLHATASARVLLAYQEQAFAEALLAETELSQFTPNTPTTIDEVLARLVRIRERGYEIAADELDRNIWTVSVPLRRGHQVMATLTVAAPMDRISGDERRAEVLESAQAAAREIESAAGMLAAL